MIIEDDDQIIKQCLSGDTEAFRYLVEKYQIRIINTCYKYTKNIAEYQLKYIFKMIINNE